MLKNFINYNREKSNFSSSSIMKTEPEHKEGNSFERLPTTTLE